MLELVTEELSVCRDSVAQIMKLMDKYSGLIFL